VSCNFPPPELPGFDGTTGLSVTPARPGLSLTGVRLAVTRRHRRGLPVLRRVSVCRHAASCTPVDSLGPIARGPAYSSRSPGRQRRRPSPGQRWVGVHDEPFGASSDVHSRYGLPARGTAETVLCVGGFDGFVTSTTAPTATGWSDPVAGREFHPLKTFTFARRTLSRISRSFSLP